MTPRQARAGFGRILSFLLWLPFAFLLTACGVRPPGRVETWLVQETKHHVTIRGSHDRNPFPATPENLRDGQKAFGYYCVNCHGRDGQNTDVAFADRMSPPVPKLTSSWVQGYTDGQLRKVIAQGVSPSGMPASEGILNDDEIWKIVLYIRHLPPAGSLGDPQSGDSGTTTAPPQASTAR